MQEYWVNVFVQAGDTWLDLPRYKYAAAVDDLCTQYRGFAQHQIKVHYSHTLYVRRGVPGVSDILQVHDLTEAAAQHCLKLDKQDGIVTDDNWQDELRQAVTGSVL